MGIRDGRTPDGREDRPMDEADGRMLLRKRDLVDKLGVACELMRVLLGYGNDSWFFRHKPGSGSLGAFSAVMLVRLWHLTPSD